MIDGRARLACAELALHHLATDGIIVVDDADRVLLHDVHLALAALPRIDFHGPKPSTGLLTTTSVYAADLPDGSRAPERRPPSRTDLDGALSCRAVESPVPIPPAGAVGAGRR